MVLLSAKKSEDSRGQPAEARHQWSHGPHSPHAGTPHSVQAMREPHTVGSPCPLDEVLQHVFFLDGGETGSWCGRIL